jgi:hypothetical protein
MMRNVMTLALILAGSAAAADRLVCDPDLRCIGETCRALPGFDAEGADYVEGAMSGAPQLYVSEGTFAPAERRNQNGTLSFHAVTAAGERVMLVVDQATGLYTMVRGTPGDVWFTTGRCRQE